MTDESKKLYRVAAQAQQDRIKHLEGQSVDRRAEIAMVRTLIERCLEQGNLSTLNSLTVTLDRLIKNHERSLVLQNNLIARDRLKLWMAELGNIIADEAKDHFPDGQWEDFLCSVADKIGASFEMLENSREEVSRLQLPR